VEVETRCYICNREDDLITYDKARKEYGPCTVCQAIIQEALDEFKEEEPSALPFEW